MVSNWGFILTNFKEAKERRVQLTESDFKEGEMDFILRFMYAGGRTDLVNNTNRFPTIS
jgi:hypothetical protein